MILPCTCAVIIVTVRNLTGWLVLMGFKGVMKTFGESLLDIGEIYFIGISECSIAFVVCKILLSFIIRPLFIES